MDVNNQIDSPQKLKIGNQTIDIFAEINKKRNKNDPSSENRRPS